MHHRLFFFLKAVGIIAASVKTAADELCRMIDNQSSAVPVIDNSMTELHMVPTPSRLSPSRRTMLSRGQSLDAESGVMFPLYEEELLRPQTQHQYYSSMQQQYAKHYSQPMF